MSLVTGGMTASGTLVIVHVPRAGEGEERPPKPARVGAGDWAMSSTTPGSRSTARHGHRHARGRRCLVEYYRCISGEHPDWDEYRQAMIDQGKCVISIEPTRWGPLSKGGFPPSLFED